MKLWNTAEFAKIARDVMDEYYKEYNKNMERYESGDTRSEILVQAQHCLNIINGMDVLAERVIDYDDTLSEDEKNELKAIAH